MKSLLLDFGSTSIKYCLFDTCAGRTGPDGAIPFPGRLPNPDKLIYEVDAGEIAAALRRILRGALRGADAILLSVQMHGYLLADGDGGLLTPYISWRDRRAMGPGIGRSGPAGADWSARGTCFRENLPLRSLRALPESGRPAELFTLGSFLTHTLTGRNASHITDCAATGFYDAATGRRAEAGFGNLRLPEALCSVRPAGEYRGAAVYPAVGDHQASFLGSRAGFGAYLLNIGTAAQAAALSQTPCMACECRPYFGGGRLCTVSGLPGGDKIRRDYRPKGADALAEELAEAYGAGLRRLPARGRLVVAGGAVRHFPGLFEAVCRRLGLPYELYDGDPALNGLKILAKGAAMDGDRDHAQRDSVRQFPGDPAEQRV